MKTSAAALSFVALLILSRLCAVPRQPPLPLVRLGQIDVIALTRVELALAQEVLPDVTAHPLVAAHLRSMGGDRTTGVLAYVLPVDYVMQGLIANTGEDWQLFRRHRTVRMMTDYLIHLVAHLLG